MRGTLELRDLVRMPVWGNGDAPLPLPPHRIGAQLPGLYQDDDFVQRFASGLDPVLATAMLALDTLEAYVDPHLTPPDFLTWLAQWVGVDLGEIDDDGRRRQLIREAAQLYGGRGTVQALRRMIELRTGHIPEIDESGGSVASDQPGAEPPGRAGATLFIRLRVPDPDDIDVDALDAFVSRAKPAHVIHHLEVVGY